MSLVHDYWWIFLEMSKGNSFSIYFISFCYELILNLALDLAAERGDVLLVKSASNAFYLLERTFDWAASRYRLQEDWLDRFFESFQLNQPTRDSIDNLWLGRSLGLFDSKLFIQNLPIVFTLVRLACRIVISIGGLCTIFLVHDLLTSNYCDVGIRILLAPDVCELPNLMWILSQGTIIIDLIYLFDGWITFDYHMTLAMTFFHVEQWLSFAWTNYFVCAIDVDRSCIVFSLLLWDRAYPIWLCVIFVLYWRFYHFFSIYGSASGVQILLFKL